MKVFAGFVGVALLLVVAVATIASGPEGSPVSATALQEIPPDLLEVYIAAADTCPGLPWQVLAAIGFVESRHAEGRANPATGDVAPPILGPSLDGTGGNARIPDPSFPDGWSHAEGPMQFLPSTWARWARLAPGRPPGASPSPENAWDSIYTAAAYLCAGHGHLTDVDAAILSYNHSDAYLKAVLAKAAEYGLGASDADVMAGGWALPGPRALIDRDPSILTRPHHDYPAWDWPVPVGTPIFAIRGGTVASVTTYGANCYGLAGCDDCGIGVTINDAAGIQWTFCHGSALEVSPGQSVVAGQQVLVSGNTGSSTGPHVHVQIRAGGLLRCPQPLMVSLYGSAIGVDPMTLPTSGCTS